MKNLILLLVCSASCYFSNAQDFTGIWKGVLEVQNTQLPLIFKIRKTDSVYISTMDSPAQGAKDISVDNTLIKDSTVIFSIKNLGLSYKGTIKKSNSISGIFRQGGTILSLDLVKKADSKRVNRPQEPISPFPYRNEIVSFQNKEGINLSGTLSFPSEIDKTIPIVILISGSGPQNRDSEVFGHKPFLVITDYLVKNKMGVLRFDDRGVGQSQGDFAKATTQDFANDVASAVDYLSSRKDVNFKEIGLIGHSEGGIIASMVANKRDAVDFIILLASPGLKGKELLLSQSEALLKKNGMSNIEIAKIDKINRKSYSYIERIKETNKLKKKLKSHLQNALKKYNFLYQKPTQISDEEFIDNLVNQMSSPWFIFFVKYNPENDLKKVKCPVLAINGENDLQVLPYKNLIAIDKALSRGKNKNYTIKTIPDLNHLFQESETGLPIEYQKIEQTFSPKVLKLMVDWIKENKVFTIK
ncbi:alpha/beta hydrolase family protein [Aquimarina sp. 2-A2]|uniref:alpha/beta hydrolase family protein n=1 Tax=Aquimarina sp. 2-A2 TaxID=3382644 RepID=UPI00387F0A90